MKKREKFLGIKVLNEIDKALNEAKWHLRMTKTEIVEEAIKEYLKRHCPEVYEEFLNEQEDRRAN